MAKPYASPQNKREECFLIEKRGKLGGPIINKKSIGLNSIQSTGASHWLSCDRLLLAGLLPEEEENLSSICWDIKVVSLCKVHLFLLGLLLMSEKS